MESQAKDIGTWYRKPKLSEKIVEKKFLPVKEKNLTKASNTAEEVRKSLFHCKCVCKLCRQYDEYKETQKKSAVASPVLKPVPLASKSPNKVKGMPSTTMTGLKTPAKKEKKVKKTTFQSNNIYSALKLNDPGNSPHVSLPKLERSHPKGKSPNKDTRKR